MYKKITFFDMDGTLIDSPMPDTGRVIWREKTGQDYPHKGWWGQPDSLNTEIFEIKPFSQVLEKLLKDKADPETLTVLLTNRIPRLMPPVLDLLKIHGIELHEYSFKTSEKNKRDRIKDFLVQYPSVEHVTVYDDQLDQIQILKEFQHEIGNTLKVEIYHATKGETVLI